MKKSLLLAVVGLALGLSACGGKSDADKQQLREAHESAREMLDNMKHSTPAPAPVQQQASVQQPDSAAVK